MHKHDWVIGLLSEIEGYCIENELDSLCAAVSAAISVAAEGSGQAEALDNVIYLSDYFDRKILTDKVRVVAAFAGNIEGLLLKD